MDQSLVLTTYGSIASELHDYESGSWILSAYLLGQCAIQPLFGKLAHIYKRKASLIAAYVLFMLGTLGAGLSQNMGQIIAFRVLQGAGGAGMTSVVAIIVTDIVLPEDVAAVRSYVNVVQTTAKSCGGVVGGFLTDVLGWRWVFLVQVPPILLAVGLVAWLVRLPPLPQSKLAEDESQLSKLKRIDIVGSFFLSTAILACCVLLDLGGRQQSGTTPLILGVAGAGVVAIVGFLVTAQIVEEPIFPLRLLRYRAVVHNYGAGLLISTAQNSFLATVPIYFQTITSTSAAATGAYLIPTFVGNTVGGLLTGIWIKRTGRYNIASISAPILSGIGMLLLFLTWRGSTSIFQTSIILLGGLAGGIIANSAFVGVVAGVKKDDVAISTSGFYLALNIGTVAGISAGNASFQAGLRAKLESSLGSNQQEVGKNARTSGQL